VNIPAHFSAFGSEKPILKRILENSDFNLSKGIRIICFADDMEINKNY